MRVAIVGAGAVGRSIAAELPGNGHTVMLIEKNGAKVRAKTVPGAEWVQADACEVSSLEEAQLATCDVVIAATGDDKANLVEVTLPAHTPLAGTPVRGLKLPVDSALVTILRGGRVIVPQGDDSLEAGDELLFVATSAVEEEIRDALGH